MKQKYIPLKVLRILIDNKSMDTNQLINECDCERKSIYSAADVLECMGFHIDISKGPKGVKVYTLDKMIFGSDE